MHETQQADPSVAGNTYIRTGWLLERRLAANGSPTLARAFAGTPAETFCWRWRFFALGPEHLSCWSSGGSEGDVCSIGHSPCSMHRLADLQCVAVDGREVSLKFAPTGRESNSQRPSVWLRRGPCLQLRARSEYEAESWGAAVRTAAAVPQLRGRLPANWEDVCAGLESQSGALAQEAVKVSLPAEAVAAMQQLVDHTFIAKRTKDRCEREVPVSLEVTSVVEVRNACVWVDYMEARSAVASTRTNATSPPQPMKPEVRTASFEADALRELLGGSEDRAHERWLFHGTTLDAVNDIVDKGFEIALAGSHRGTMYGQGVYLAECCSKADEYAEVGPDGVCGMLLCRAALGNVLVDSAKCPDSSLESRCKASFDSLCGDRWAAVGTFREFIVYDAHQVYPAYILYYRRMLQAQIMKRLATGIEKHDLDACLRLVPLAAKLATGHPGVQVRRVAWERLDAYVRMPRTEAHIVEGFPSWCRWVSENKRPALVVTAMQLLVQSGAVTAAASAVPALARYLGGNDRDLRERAALCLGSVREHTDLTVALSPLIENLKSENGEVRAVSTRLLGQLGAAASPALPALVEILRGSNRDAQEAACSAIQQLGIWMAPVMPMLTECLRDECTFVRVGAAEALGQLGARAAPALPAMLECLKDPEPQACQAAVVALGQIGVTALSLVPSLAEHLRDEREHVRRAAATVLGQLASHSSAAIPVFVECLVDERDFVCCTAAEALGRCGAHAATAVPNLVKRLERPGASREVQVAVISALADLGEHAVWAVPALIRCLDHEDAAVHGAGVEALGSIGQSDLCAATTLSRCLFHDRASVRYVAITASGGLGSHASVAVPALMTCLHDEDPHVRRLAAAAMGRLGELAACAVPDLINTLQDSDPEVRKAAVAALGQLGMHNASAAQALVRCIKDESAHVRIAASEAFGKLGDNAALVVPDLAAGLRDESPVLRRAAAAAVGQLGAHAIAAAPALAECVVDDDDSVCRAATTALMKLGANAALAVPVLVRSVACQRHWKNDRALKVLRLLFFKYTASCVAVLTECLKDGSEDVRSTAAEALQRFSAEEAPTTSTPEV